MRRILGQEPRDCYRVGPDAAHRGSLLSLPRVPQLLALHFLVYLAFNFFYVAFPVHAAVGLGWGAGAVGAFFAGMGLAMAVAEGPVLEAASRRAGGRTLVVTGSALLAAGFTAFTAEGTGAVAAGVVLVALGNGLMWPSLLALVSEAAGERRQGAVHGVAGGLAALASIGGLVTGGVLYDRLGPAVFVWAGGVAAVVAGLATIFAPPGSGAGREGGPDSE